jgi:hypothetical protein
MRVGFARVLRVAAGCLLRVAPHSPEADALTAWPSASGLSRTTRSAFFGLAGLLFATALPCFASEPFTLADVEGFTEATPRSADSRRLRRPPQTLEVTDLVFEAGPNIPATNHWFTQIFAAHTPEVARTALKCLHEKHTRIGFGVYQVPQGRATSAFAIVTASYATEAEALQSLGAKIDYNALRDCLADPAHESRDWERIGPQNFRFDLRTPNDTWPRLIARTPLQPFDGFGQQRSQAFPPLNTGSEAKHPPPILAMVQAVAFTDRADVAVRIDALRTTHPDVRFAVLQQGLYFFIATAGFVSDARLAEARTALRQRGLYTFAHKATFGAVTQGTTQKTPSARSVMDDSDFPIRGETAGEVSVDTTVARLDPEDLVEPVAQRVQRCYAQSGAIELAALPEQFASCSGIVMSPLDLSRCLLDSSCLGVRVPIGFNDDPAVLLRTCLSPADMPVQPVELIADDPITNAKNLANEQLRFSNRVAIACQSVAVHPVIRDLLTGSELGAECLKDVEGTGCTGLRERIAYACEDPENKTICSKEPDLMASLPERFDAVQTCLKTGQCGAVVPRPADVADRVRAAYARVGVVDMATRLVPARHAIAITKITDAAEQARRLSACIALRDTDQGKAAACFRALAFTEDENDTLKCWTDPEKRGNPESYRACLPADANSQAALATVDCLAGDYSLASLARCAPQGTKEAIDKATECASNASSSIAFLETCVGQADPRFASDLACLKAHRYSAVDLALCLSPPAPAFDTATCLAGATDKLARLRCIASSSAVDASTRARIDQAMSCVGAASSAEGSNPGQIVNAVATCTGGLPTEVSQALTCISRSDVTDPQSIIASCGSGFVDPKAVAAACAVSAATDEQRLQCVAGVLPIDPKTAAAIACAAGSGGNTEALIGCAANAVLPPEIAHIASCAATSSGPTSFGLCAVAPQMNPELRIAAECAVASGGEPMSTAACTAGQLTIRELTKCLQGEIGKPGGCFGPNNTIIKHYTNVFNDLTKGLGPNNDLRTAAEALGGAIGDVGKGLEREANTLLRQATRGDVGKAVCRVLSWGRGCR